MAFKPRPKQQEVIDYASGHMGVSAVPGSGKTRTLSYLAAKLVASGGLRSDQEVLIVTLVNSAVDNFSRQVGEFVQERGLLPNFAYRVRTLHGLANDIVRARPDLVALDEGFQIVDERESQEILEEAAIHWARSNPEVLGHYINDSIDENQFKRLSRERWPRDVTQIAGNFIKQAKDLMMAPEDVRRGLDRFGEPLPLAEMGWQIYVNYQRALNYRGAVDFQDLIRYALYALESDEQYRQRLHEKWPYILEDEAQDSSELQERIIRHLAGEQGNWVRVGDPNQAIYETFTTAKPEYLRNFLQEKGVQARELPNSGRSTRSIIKLANYLIDWSSKKHPSKDLRQRAPLQPPRIKATPRGDPQPNPKDDPDAIYIRAETYTPAEEVEAVTASLKRWLPDHQDQTVAVLVPRNDRGTEVVNALKTAGLDVVELLRSTSATRETAGALALIFDHLSQPNDPPSLARVYEVWRRDEREDPDARGRLRAVIKALRGCKQVEDFVWPQLDRDWIDTTPAVTELIDDDDTIRDHLLHFRELLRRWQEAVILPVDQLILTLAQEIFSEPVDLAIAHSLALIMRRDSETNPDWRLPQFTDELKKIARNKRRVLGISEDDTGFDPTHHKGKVTVATMHRAKGLEWDRVYLMSVNNYGFPSDEPQDTFISEKWYVRDDLNLEAEALAQLNVLRDSLTFDFEYGPASREARLDYVAERLRLLYVGITRARRELVITYNTGRDGKRQQATALIALQTYWESQRK